MYSLSGRCDRLDLGRRCKQTTLKNGILSLVLLRLQLSKRVKLQHRP